jgi:CRP-like cAMP-binding protein
MSSEIKRSLQKFFTALPAYTPNMDEALTELIDAFEEEIFRKKGEVISELSPPNRDFWFLSSGLLKEVYRSKYNGEETLFNIIPNHAIFANEDTLLLNKRPLHFFQAYSDVTFAQLKAENFEKLLLKYPVINLLYLSVTAEIQRNRRSRLTMLRMNKTTDRILWVRENRNELYRQLDRITLAQYIGVSRASLYRAFDKQGKSQY